MEPSKSSKVKNTGNDATLEDGSIVLNRKAYIDDICGRQLALVNTTAGKLPF